MLSGWLVDSEVMPQSLVVQLELGLAECWRDTTLRSAHVVKATGSGSIPAATNNGQYE